MPAAFAWTGTLSACRAAGFQEVGRGSPKRPIMRAYPGALLVRRRRGTSTEHDGKSRRALSHHRGLPAAATPLIQQIGESVLILLHVPRELEDDGLVFVHGREGTAGNG